MGESTSWRSVGPEHCDLLPLLPLVVTVWEVEGEQRLQVLRLREPFATWRACSESIGQGGRKRALIAAWDKKVVGRAE